MIVFLKLGGSLITDKTRPYTPRLDVLDELAHQIASACRENARLSLVLGHGSGSFGHQAATQYGTRNGVSGKKAWHGFAEVWYRASELNRLVVTAMRNASLSAITLSPLAAVTSRNGKVISWDLAPLEAALVNHLLPVLHGDVVFDQENGGTILSTENLFTHLALRLHPERILMAGLEAGVWDDFPARTRLIKEITRESFEKQAPSLRGSTGADVTGGMQTKVSEMLTLVEQVPGLEVLIFSGETPGNVRRALHGENPGTRVYC
jgi:isopentenyl phosphate kinase